MFKPSTARIAELAKKFPHVETDLDPIFDGHTVVYIDYGNVCNWCNRLGWHVDIKRVKQLLDSFDSPTLPRFYYGTRVGNAESEEKIRSARAVGYDVRTKPVKAIQLSIDVRPIAKDSTDVIKNFVFNPLLKTFSIETIEYLNKHLKSLNESGTMYFEDLKCNFDVEIGRDMLVDMIAGHSETGDEFENFVLWSCDSDFADPVSQLLDNDRNVYVFGVSGMVARELNQLRAKGLKVYDVRKIKEMICWSKELTDDLRKLGL
jgi:hypothetical protein